MAKMRLFCLFGLAFYALITGVVLIAQTDDLTAMQQKLNTQFKVTKLTGDGMDILEGGAGDVVELHKDGLKMSALATPVMESSVYKDGKIGGGAAKRVWGNLGVAMLEGMAAAGDNTGTVVIPNAIPGHNAVAGEKVWVVAVTAQKDGINFKLYTDADPQGIRYHANLKVLYPNKKVIPSVDDALKLVSEVLTVVPQGDQGEQPAPEGPYAAFAGEYLMPMSRQRYSLLPDGSCTITTPGVPQPALCQFTVEGDWLAMTIKIGANYVPLMKIKIQDGRLFMNGMSSLELVRQGGSPAPEPEAVAPPATPAPAPMQEIAPPPPPADAPPATIELGQSKDQVTAGFGQPLRVAKLGAKTIFYYKDMKVTFTDGKVSNVE
jgi:hypothetical protein